MNLFQKEDPITSHKKKTRQSYKVTAKKIKSELERAEGAKIAALADALGYSNPNSLSTCLARMVREKKIGYRLEGDGFRHYYLMGKQTPSTNHFEDYYRIIGQPHPDALHIDAGHEDEVTTPADFFGPQQPSIEELAKSFYWEHQSDSLREFVKWYGEQAQ